MPPASSRLVAGFWRLHQWGFEAPQLVDFIEACLDLGISSLDLADVYGDGAAEALMGAALSLQPGLRERVEITTKVNIVAPSGRFPRARRHHYDTSRRHIVGALEASLRRLKCEHVDVLLLHREDPLLDPDEVSQAFDELRDAGKALRFGVSNFGVAKVELLSERLSEPLATNQIEASVLCLDPWRDGTLDQCHRLEAAPMAWSPLAGGRLFTDESPRAERVRRALEVVAEAHEGAGLDQVALAWLLCHPSGLRPILGTGRVERVRSAAAAQELLLDREEWFDIWCASSGAPLP